MANLKKTGLPAPISGDGPSDNTETAARGIPPHPPHLAHGAVPGGDIWNGARIQVSDVPMWSTYRFVPSGKEIPSDIRLFNASIGQYGQGFGHGHALSLCDTNVREQGKIADGYPMEVTAVAWDVWGCERDRRHIYDTGTWSWDFIRIRFIVSPLSGLRHISDSGGVVTADGHLRSCHEYPEGAMFLPGGTSFNILFQIDTEYKFRDECFVRFFLYGKYTPGITV